MSSSNVVSTTTRVLPGLVVISRVASMPSVPGHADVHHDDVRVEILGQMHGLGAGAGFADDLDIGGVGDDHLQGATDQGVVVGEHNPDRHPVAAVAGAGSRAVTWKPPSGCGPAVKNPCTSATRSRMPTRP